MESDKLQYLAKEITKQSVKDAAWFLLAVYTKMWDERYIEERIVKQEGTIKGRFGNSQTSRPISITKKMRKHTLKEHWGCGWTVLLNRWIKVGLIDPANHLSRNAASFWGQIQDKWRKAADFWDSTGLATRASLQKKGRRTPRLLGSWRGCLGSAGTCLTLIPGVGLLLRATEAEETQKAGLPPHELDNRASPKKMNVQP